MKPAAFLRWPAIRRVLAWLLPIPICVVQWFLWDQLQPMVWVLFLLVVLVAPVIGGFWGGIGATLISALLAWYFFVPPQLSFAYEHASSIAALLVFVGTGFGISLFQEYLHRSKQKLAHEIEERRRVEAALRQSETKLSKIFHLSPVGLSLTRLDNGQLLDVNAAFAHLTGYRREEMIGHTVIELGLNTRATRDMMLKNLQHGHVENFELTITRRSGEVRSWLLSAETTEMEEGPCLLATVVDLTAIKEAERERAFLSAIVQSSHDAIVSIDFDGRITSWNRGAEQIYGKTTAEVIGANLFAIIAPEQVAHMPQTLQRIRGGQVLQLPDHTWATPAGERLVLAVTLGPVQDQGGDVIGVVSVARDITDRKAAEQKLRDSEERFRTLVENSPSPIAIWDDNGLMRYISPSCVPVLGHSQAELLRRAALVHSHYEQLQSAPFTSEVAAELGLFDSFNATTWLSIMKMVRYCAHHLGESVIGSEQLMLPDNTARDLQIICQGIARESSSSESVGSEVVTILHDLTEHRTLERLLQQTNADLEQQVAARTAELTGAMADLQQANQAKDEFLAAVSHELRTPLTAVLGMTELLQAQYPGPLNQRQLAYLDMIQDSGERLLTLVNEVLQYMAVVSGRIVLQWEWRRLEDLATAAVHAVRPRAEQKGLTLKLSVELPEMEIKSDGSGIEGILKELLNNAIKFTPEGGSIGLDVRHATNERAVHLTVWDTGIGMPVELQTRLFQPFMQADARLDRAYEGLGLGLAYAQRMVELLGGAITVESAVGEGSRFCVTLPRQCDSQEAPRA